ncbi:MAG: DNA polymerase IV [Candidatus Bathyarchaeota archaeon]|nr:MAG: DNA polymerase IV [Candidatus Bathyarchaeota archaeon]
MHTRIVMLVDLDYFFAQSEERRNPSIKDKPVVVCVYSGRTQDSGAVSTANYVARQYGVKSGIPISLAKKRLEGIDSVFLPVDKPFYTQISDSIMDVLRSYADHFEQVSVDEAYLDVTEKTRGSYLRAKKLAKTIKNEIFRQQQLTCSVGVGPNKLVAKIAADYQKPDGLTVVQPENVFSFLAPLPVRTLVGVGKKTEKTLESLNVHTVGHLAKFDVQQLVDLFGRKLGAYFHNAALGIDDDPVEERGDPESIGRISTLKEDSQDLTVILDKAYKLCADVHSRLLTKGLLYRTVTIRVVGVNLDVHSRSNTLENPTNSLETLKDEMKQLFEKFFQESDVKARRIGVTVSSLSKNENQQKTITSFFGGSNN